MYFIFVSSYFFDSIKRSDRIYKLCCIFIRSYLLYLFNTNKDLPIITTNFIRMAFRVLSKVDGGRPPDKNNLEILSLLNDYYENEFKIKLKIADKFDASNLSYILGQMNDEILIAIENNIKYHFVKHISKFIHVNFKQQLADKLIKKSNIEQKETKTKHYSDLAKIKDSILNNIDLDIDDYKKWISDNKNYLMPNNCTFIDLANNNPTQLIKNMFHINKYLEQNKEKSFQVFPIKTTMYTNYVKINTSALVDLFVKEDKLKTFQNISNQKQSLWNKYFDLSKLKLKDHTFNCEIETDGFAVSINFIHNNDLNKQIKTNNCKKNKRIESNLIKITYTEEQLKEHLQNKKEEELKKNKQYMDISKIKKKEQKEAFKKLPKEEQYKIKINEALKEEFPYIEHMVQNELMQKWIKDKKNNGQIVCGDPGKRSILYLFGDKEKPISEKEEYKLSDYKFMNYTNKERIHALKRLKYGELIEHKKQKIIVNNKSMKVIESEMANYNSKSCIYDSFINYIIKKREVENQLYNAYSDEYFRKLKWFSYLNKRRHEDQLLNRIEKVYGKDILLIIGNWGDHMNLKFISTPNVGIKRKLKERFKVFLLDEYKTSKLHYKHEIACENIEYKVKEIKQTKTIRFKNKKTKKRTKKIIKRVIKQKKPKEDKKEHKLKETRKLHSVLTYKLENNGSGCINRDKNACMNFKIIVNSLIATKERPKRFQRKTKTNGPFSGNPLEAEEVHIGKPKKVKQKDTEKKSKKLIKKQVSNKVNLKDEFIITKNKKETKRLN